MCDRNAKSEYILMKFCALVFESICEITTTFHEKILFDSGVINLQTPTTKCFQYSITYCSHLSRSDVVLWEPVRCSRNRWCVSCCEQSGHTDLFFFDQGTKVNGQYYGDVLLHQQLLPAICDLSGDFFTLQWDSAPAHRAHLTTAVNLWNTRLHCFSSVASQQSWPEPSRLPDVGEASQLDAWHWPAEL